MNLAKFLQEDNGKLSATRLVLLLWVIGLLGVWVAGSIHNIYLGQALVELPTSTITLVGILTAGKVVQKYEEKPGVATEPDTTSTATVKGQPAGSTQPAS